MSTTSNSRTRMRDKWHTHIQWDFKMCFSLKWTKSERDTKGSGEGVAVVNAMLKLKCSAAFVISARWLLLLLLHWHAPNAPNAIFNGKWKTFKWATCFACIFHFYYYYRCCCCCVSALSRCAYLAPLFKIKWTSSSRCRRKFAVHFILSCLSSALEQRQVSLS